MPTVTIDDRIVEVPAGTNLIDAGQRVGVQIPHYCYHPRLSVVGQCRMCMVEIEGMPKLQAACSTQVVKDGMVVRTRTAAVVEAQRAVMEFLLINHPLDCPICDQAGECGLQDYSFKHGQAFSRFRYEEKRTYPEKERIPLGPHVLLNMNRCIHCTRCVRFTEEVSGTGELGFFQRGAHKEIGVFPGKPLDNPLSTCVVDLCPVGALTSTRFRFAERVWYLDKRPSLCTGCDVGCNVTIEHRRGRVRRYKPRVNPEVNDHWMCDHGRTTPERYTELPRLAAPRARRGDETRPVGWREAIDAVTQRLRARSSDGTFAFLGSGFLSTEEAYLLSTLAEAVGSPHRAVWVDSGPPRRIPNPAGWLEGRDAAPNRRGAELAGLVPGPGGIDASELLVGAGAGRCSVLFVADSDFGRAAHDAKVVERLRAAQFLVVMGWADTPLARAADLALPVATHAERDGTFVNVAGRLQRFGAAFPPPTQVRDALSVLVELLARFRPEVAGWSVGEVFAEMARRRPAFSGHAWARIPATGSSLASAPEPTAAAQG
ncbi:MAG: 2Fe-2S iron-sulfur cluster-binding protein [Thermoanaerobaculia bacterium]|nr:2Fe-2S iron-sulfur cluster-binding protein [Thermoanaerobaculia bacterium]